MHLSNQHSYEACYAVTQYTFLHIEMPHHGFFALTGHQHNASFAQALPPWCRIYWLHRHERSNEIKLKPIKIRQVKRYRLKVWKEKRDVKRKNNTFFLHFNFIINWCIITVWWPNFWKTLKQIPVSARGN